MQSHINIFFSSSYQIYWIGTKSDKEHKHTRTTKAEEQERKKNVSTEQIFLRLSWFAKASPELNESKNMIFNSRIQ